MNLELSEEQRMLSDLVFRLVGDEYDAVARRVHAEGAHGWSEVMWSRYAELGLLGLPLPESAGGLNAGGVEIMLVMEAFGKALVLEPYMATVLLGAAAIQHAGTEAQRECYLPRVAEGLLKLALAHSELESRHVVTDVICRAERRGDRWHLTGKKTLVLHGESADLLVVSARISGDRRAPGGIGLFIADPHAPGVGMDAYRLQDDRGGADFEFTDVACETLLGGGECSYETIEKLQQGAIAALASEAVGAMSELVDMTVSYLKDRQQFGRPLAENQALRHKAVDMLVACEQARSMALLAVLALQEPDAPTRSAQLSMVKVQIGQSARFVGQAAVQLHGGIALSESFAVGAYFKRLLVIEHLFGDSRHHLALLADEIK